MASYAGVVAGCGFKGPPIPNAHEEKSSSENEAALIIVNDFFSLVKNPYSLSDYRKILERIRNDKILSKFIFSELLKIFFEKRFKEELTQEQFIVRFDLFCENPSNLEKLETEEMYEFETDRVQDFIVALVGDENIALNSIFESLFPDREVELFKSASLEAQLESFCYDQDLDDNEFSLENRPAMFIIEKTLRDFLKK